MAQRRRSEPDRPGPGTEESEHPQAPPSGAPARQISNDEISNRAYELYEQRGREDGRDWDDWLEAERELQARRRTPGPTPS